MKKRFLAFLSHFLASCFVISIFLLVVFFIWYPAPYDTVYATWEVIKIVVVVDIILGPFFTFIIYNHSKPKKELSRDISIIIAIQLAALFWGIHVTHKVRPIFAVYSEGDFYTFHKQDIDLNRMKKPNLIPGIFERPNMVYVLPPKDPKEAATLVTEMFTKNEPELAKRTERYVSINEHLDKVLKSQMNIKDIIEKDNKAKLIIDQFMSLSDKPLEDFAFYPLNNAFFAGTLVHDSHTLEIVDLLDKIYVPLPPKNMTEKPSDKETQTTPKAE